LLLILVLIFLQGLVRIGWAKLALYISALVRILKTNHSAVSPNLQFSALSTRKI